MSTLSPPWSTDSFGDSLSSLPLSNHSQDSPPAPSISYARVFWPAHASRVPSGFLLGWNPRGFQATVLTVVSDQSLEALESLVTSLGSTGSGAFDHLSTYLGAPLVVLGQWHAPSMPGAQSLFQAPPAERLLHYDFWLHVGLDPASSLPVLQGVQCCGIRYQPEPHFIFYHHPFPGAFYLLRQADLVLSHFKAPPAPPKSIAAPTALSPLQASRPTRSAPAPATAASAPVHSPAAVEEEDAADAASATVAAISSNTTIGGAVAPFVSTTASSSSGSTLWMPVSKSDLKRHASPALPFTGVDSFELVLRQINHGPSVEGLLSFIANSSSSSSSSSPLNSEVTSHPSDILFLPIPFFALKSRPASSPLVSLASFLGQFLRDSLLLLSGLKIFGENLREYSYCFHHIHTRFSRFSEVLLHWSSIQRDSESWKKLNYHIALRSAISAHISLACVDHLLGLMVGFIIWHNQAPLTAFLLRDAPLLHDHSLQPTVRWLMGWPAGLKLNDSLNSFLGRFVLTLSQAWVGTWQSLCAPFGTYLMAGLSLSGIFGLSMMLAILSDALSFATLHLTLISRLTSTLFHTEISSAIALFHLFRGKKRNMLRRRIDSQAFQDDALLVGTLLFVALVFLAPTVFVYMALFYCLRLIVRVLLYSASLLRAYLFAFPLASLVRSIMSPLSIPGGVRLSPMRLLPKTNGATMPLNPIPLYFELQIVPLPLSSILSQSQPLLKEVL